MTDLDGALTGRWWAALPPHGPAVDAEVRHWLTDAVLGLAPSEMPGPATGPLRRYLHGMAVGIAGARSAPMGTGDPMCLAAGLLAGAAALDHAGDNEFANAARAAGMAAADRAVEGGGLAEVAAAAARIARDGPLRALLVALARAALPPDPPAEPASCGAGPGEVAGAAFVAEVIFTTAATGADLRDLRDRLTGLAHETWFWPVSGETQVHLHTDRPGECIEQAYAAGLVFALTVTARTALRSPG